MGQAPGSCGMHWMVRGHFTSVCRSQSAEHIVANCGFNPAAVHVAVAVPLALTLSADHRKHFLSTLVMLITGQSVRAGTTDPSILHLILTMLRKWLLDPSSAHLTSKELLVIIQRIAQVGCNCRGHGEYTATCACFMCPSAELPGAKFCAAKDKQRCQACT